jgi:hypothetical protein
MKTMIAIVAVAFLFVQAAYGQQTPPLFVPYQPPSQPPYVPISPAPVPQAQVQTAPQQPVPMYDRSYMGPMNIYGQPVFSSAPRSQAGQRQTQTVRDGIIPRIGWGLQGVGTYFWSYMPAPVRGETSPYDMQPGSGHVSVNFVPGSR